MVSIQPPKIFLIECVNDSFNVLKFTFSKASSTLRGIPIYKFTNSRAILEDAGEERRNVANQKY